jgi:hypothetical protein
MFFPEASPEHLTACRLVKQLRQAAIPYALMGAMAVKIHGARSVTPNVEVLLTRQGLDQLRTNLASKVFDQVPSRPQRFTDMKNGILVEVRVTGHYPGRTGPGPFAYPDPTETSEEINQARVLRLPQLIQLNLAEQRYWYLADVVSLIVAHQLDESYLPKLHPAIHRDYLACLEEKRRQDEFEARQA